MTAPDRIWVDRGFQPWRVWTVEMPDLPEYLRRDPAALAAEPIVQALIGAAYLSAEIAVGSVDPQNEDDATAQQISEVEAIRLLTPAGATAALQRMLREARNEGREQAASAIKPVDVYGDQRYFRIPGFHEEGCCYKDDDLIVAALGLVDRILSLKEPTDVKS